MNKVTQAKPSNATITDSRPVNASLSDPKPQNLNLTFPNFTYIETRTILKGQPLPWGINWAITYPTTLVFQGARI